MAAVPPPPPAWPGADDKPAAPVWNPDVDKPASAVAQPENSNAGGVTTPSGSLEAGYVPPVHHPGMCDDCSCSLDCDPVGAVQSACDSTWLCRGYIALLFLLTILLSVIIVLVGVYASSYRGALAGVLVLSLLGPALLGGLQAFTFCSRDFEDEAGTWCYMTATTYWIFVVVMFATCHTIVVVTSPTGLRNYRQLAIGKTFTGSIRDPQAFAGSYRFFNFTDAMFFPGTAYAGGAENTVPAPTNTDYEFRCGKYTYKSFCETPVVPRDFSFVEPIRVWAGCTSRCGYPDTCATLMSGRTSNRPDCFQQWAKTNYGDPIFGYKHLVYTDQHRGAKNEIGTDTAPDAIYIRISSKEHIDDKKRRYKKYGILVEALVFGIFFGCCLVTLILIFACI